MADSLALLESIIGQEYQSARGRKARQGLVLSVIRDLEPQDLEALQEAPKVPMVQPNSLMKLRHTHHLLARLLAEGRKHVEVSLITGYSASRISILKGDPAFQELLAYYQGQQEAIYANVHERRSALGLSALEELNERLEERPDTFSNRETMDLMSLCLDGQGKGQGQGPGQGVKIAIQFVEPSRQGQGQGQGQSHSAKDITGDHQIIDVEIQNE